MIATGQFTIYEIFDSTDLFSGMINSNHGKTQFFNAQSNTYKPDFSTNNLILTPSIYRNGRYDVNIVEKQNEILSNKKWQILRSNNKWETVSQGSDKLIVTDNLTEDVQRHYKYSCKILGSNGVQTDFTLHYQILKEKNDENLYYLLMSTPLGNSFDVSTLNKKLTIECKVLSAGNTVRNLSTNHFRWFKKTSKNIKYAEPEIPDGYYEIKNGFHWDSTKNVCVLPLEVEDVDSLSEFLCVFHSEETNGYYYGREKFYNNVRLSQIFIQTSNGGILRNRNELTRLTARLIDRGEETDYYFPYNCIYEWTAKENGKIVNDWFKTGKNIIVGGTDVNSSTDFICEATSIDLLDIVDNIVIKKGNAFYKVEINKQGQIECSSVTLPSDHKVDPFIISDILGDTWELIINDFGELATKKVDGYDFQDTYIRCKDYNELYKIISVAYGRIKAVSMNTNTVTEINLTSPSGYLYSVEVTNDGDFTTKRMSDNVGIKNVLLNDWNMSVDDNGYLLTTKTDNPDSRLNYMPNFYCKGSFNIYTVNAEDDGTLTTTRTSDVDGYKEIGIRGLNGETYRLRIDQSGTLILDKSEEYSYFIDSFILRDPNGYKWKLYIDEDEELLSERINTTVKELDINIKCYESAAIFTFNVDTDGFIEIERIK